ncbi:hypothetical protein [Umezawaea sp. Da 62-37]|uniref:hypothetical protein n=1 Tax=Umezawaea sp. Da 62-37 TaxID=3075927 RepID=UPI0028F7077C|nr:hypothetical protein [Umezawaea sp. Da 62-37]WNV87992.1 hypothetical protein RM788_06810 [Umezawaea sp. Da 62-37]
MTAPSSAQDGLDLDPDVVEVSRLGFARHRELDRRLAELQEAIRHYRDLRGRYRAEADAGRGRERGPGDVGNLFEARTMLHDAGQALSSLASECYVVLSETYAFVYAMVVGLDPCKETIAFQAQPLADLLAHLGSLDGPEVPDDVRERVDEVVSALVLAAGIAAAHVGWMGVDFELPDVQDACAAVVDFEVPHHEDAAGVLRLLTGVLALNGAEPSALSTFFAVLTQWLGEAKDLARHLDALGERCAAVRDVVSVHLANLEVDDGERESLARFRAELAAFEQEVATTSDSDVQLTVSDSDSDSGPDAPGPRVLGRNPVPRMLSIDPARLDLPSLVADDERLKRLATRRGRFAEAYRKAAAALAEAGRAATVDQYEIALGAVEQFGLLCTGQLKTAFRQHIRMVDGVKREVDGLLEALTAAANAAIVVGDVIGDLSAVPSRERDTRVKNTCGQVVVPLRGARKQLDVLAPHLPTGVHRSMGDVVEDLLAHFSALPRLEGFAPATGSSMTSAEFDRVRKAAKDEVLGLAGKLGGVQEALSSQRTALAVSQSHVLEASVDNDNLASALRELAEELRRALG